MKASVLFFMCVLSCASLFGYDIDAGRRIGMGGTILITSPSASDFLLVPAVRILNRQILFESGFQRRYDLPELDKGYLAAGYRRRSFSFAIGISQFGKDDYYSEKIIRTALGFYYGAFAFGLHGSGKAIKIGNGYGAFNAKSFGLSGGFSHEEYHLVVMADNLNKPKLTENTEPEPTFWKIYAELKGSKTFSITGKMVLEKRQKISVALGQYIFLSGRNAIFWGLTGNPLTYAGGVEVSYSKIILNYAASYHPALGFSHNVSLGLALKK